MLDISLLKNPIQNYPWGSKTAIAKTLGRPPASEPQAELWMGAHPKAPSEVLIDGQWVRLDALVQQHSDAVLGPGKRAFPFLFKILAAERPLSIQAHPNSEQARQGFEREERLGIPRDARERNYRDPNSKPELVYALTPFSMLRGFRSPRDLFRLAEALEILDLLPGVEHLTASANGLKAFFSACTPANETERRRLQPVLEQAVEKATKHARTAPEFACMCRLAEFYPSDPGILAPLFLQLIELRPGEALFTGPGILHAYLEGLGIELMSNSDNVLRGSLTQKHIDVPELMRVLDFSPASSNRLIAESRDGEDVFTAPEGGFELRMIEVAEEHPHERLAGRVEILLCHRGRGRIENPKTGFRLEFSQGDALLVPASVSAFRIVGETALFSASGPPVSETRFEALSATGIEASYLSSGSRA